MQYQNTVKVAVPPPNAPSWRTEREASSFYDFDHQNESRADLAETALIVSTDRAGETDVNDVYTDVSDALANIRHFCDRAGIDWNDVVAHAERAYDGDGEDGEPTHRDSERFPD